jgi:hypothetical protein
MDDLIAFVKARLDEDEAGADEVHLPRTCSSVDRDGDFDTSWCDCYYPARVLREVAAKRAILDSRWGGPDHADMWESCVLDLATVWSDHPDYRQEWKP